MLERFTDAARHAIASAGEVAREVGSEEVAPVHLLAGLAADVGPAGGALERSGVTADGVREAASRLSPARGPSTTRRIGFTPAASLVIESSLRIARERDAPRIDAHDLLLSLLRRPGEDVLAVLDALGADPDDIRRAVLPPEG